MSDEKKNSNSTNVILRVVPFTGAFFAIWAIFWPEGYGTWLGTIVRAFRVASGI